MLKKTYLLPLSLRHITLLTLAAILLILSQGTSLYIRGWLNIVLNGGVKQHIRNPENMPSGTPEILNAKIAQDPENRSQMGKVYFLYQKAPEAIIYLRKAHRDEFEEAVTGFWLGKLLWEQGEEQEALQVWSAIEAEDYYLTQGKGFMQAENSEEAEEAFHMALLIDENRADAHLLLGQVFMKNEQYELAAEELRKATQLDGELVEAFIGLGHASRYTGKLNEALQAYQNAKRLSPENWLLDYSLASVYFQLGNMRLAEEHLRSFFANSQSNPDAHALLGEIYIKQGKWTAAEKELTTAITLFPSGAKYYALLGEAYLSQQREREATEAFIKGYCMAGSGDLQNNILAELISLGKSKPICTE